MRFFIDELGADPNAVTNDGSTLAHTMLTGFDRISSDISVDCLRFLLARCTDKELLQRPRASVRTRSLFAGRNRSARWQGGALVRLDCEGRVYFLHY